MGMTNETIEGNKLIAEFIRWEWHDEYVAYGMVHPRGYYSGDIAKDGVLGIEPHLLKFHSSWDWLMPVVEKIEQLGFMVNINGDECYITPPDNKGKLVCHTSRWGKITTVYQAVLSTIKWYNHQNPKP